MYQFSAILFFKLFWHSSSESPSFFFLHELFHVQSEVHTHVAWHLALNQTLLNTLGMNYLLAWLSCPSSMSGHTNAFYWRNRIVWTISCKWNITSTHHIMWCNTALKRSEPRINIFWIELLWHFCDTSAHQLPANKLIPKMNNFVIFL